MQRPGIKTVRYKKKQKLFFCVSNKHSVFIKYSFVHVTI